MEKKQLTYILTAAAIIIALIGSYFGITLPAPSIPVPEQASRAAGANVDTSTALIVKNYITDQGTLSVAGASTLTGAVAFGANPVFEGATADAYETTFAITDPTADRTITFPDETGAVIVSSLATNGTAITNSVTGASNALVWEGATADAYETSVTVTDPTADRTFTLPNFGGTLLVSSTANEPDTGNAFWVNTGDLKWEGSTANAYETTLTPTDPTAARTITLPNASGTVGLFSGVTTMVMGSTVITGTGAVTHGLTTPLYCIATMHDDPVDDQEDRVTCSISGATVTAKVWKEAATPTAGDSGVTVYWIIGGTP